MITTIIKGGMGNQMFQYAAGYALSRNLGVAMQLDLSFYNKQDKRKFELAELCIDFETHSSATKDRISKKAQCSGVGAVLWIILMWIILMWSPLHAMMLLSKT